MARLIFFDRELRAIERMIGFGTAVTTRRHARKEERN
jgi:hypothetical protein